MRYIKAFENIEDNHLKNLTFLEDAFIDIKEMLNTTNNIVSFFSQIQRDTNKIIYTIDLYFSTFSEGTISNEMYEEIIRKSDIQTSVLKKSKMILNMIKNDIKSYEMSGNDNGITIYISLT